jgi:hypothetical protein
MTKQLALQQVVRQRRAVKFDERGGGARRIMVDGVGDQLFPGAALAAYQHRGIPAGNLTNNIHNLPHRRAFADHILQAETARRVHARGRSILGLCCGGCAAEVGRIIRRIVWAIRLATVSRKRVQAGSRSS